MDELKAAEPVPCREQPETRSCLMDAGEMLPIEERPVPTFGTPEFFQYLMEWNNPDWIAVVLETIWTVTRDTSLHATVYLNGTIQYADPQRKTESMSMKNTRERKCFIFEIDGGIDDLVKDGATWPLMIPIELLPLTRGFKNITESILPFTATVKLDGTIDNSKRLVNNYKMLQAMTASIMARAAKNPS